MRIALCQINTTVGDLPGNAEQIGRFARRAAERGAELAVFPELSLTGYPPRDLVEKPSFLDWTEQTLDDLAAGTAHLNIPIICGWVARADASTGKRARNSAALIEGGRVVFEQSKMLLPTYDVFDEARYFRAGRARISVPSSRPSRSRSTICEDAWNDSSTGKQRLYQRDPVEELLQRGRRDADLHQCIAVHMGKRRSAAGDFRATARRYAIARWFT